MLQFDVGKFSAMEEVVASRRRHVTLVAALFLSFVIVVFSVTDPNDVGIIKQFRDGLENPELLNWPENGDDPCGPPSWDHIFCTGNRVSQIQVQGMGLKGPLPSNLNNLSKLKNLGLQKNKFSGMLPSFSGLAELRWAYLDLNTFDSIAGDFFDGLTSVEVLALDYNDFNATTGWSLPNSLGDLTQLANFTCSSCNIAGPLPESLGSLSSLRVLRLNKNRLSGSIPESFGGSIMETLWLNDQTTGSGMTGSIHVVASMVSLTTLWLNDNHFTGTIPENIGDVAGLKDLNLNGNNLVGLIPDGLASLKLDNLDLGNNQLMGPIPKFQAVKASYLSNSFCQSVAGSPCAPQVMALLQFVADLNYPSRLVSSWSGNDPCADPWVGLICNSNGKVSIINMTKFNLSGSLSPSLAGLDSIKEIRLGTNNLTGLVPSNWTSLSSLNVLDLSGNNISPPIPKFRSTVKVVLDGNPLLNGKNNHSTPTPSTGNISTGIPETSSNNSSSPPTKKPGAVNDTPGKSSNLTLIIIGIIAGFTAVFFVVLFICCLKKRKNRVLPPNLLLIHPRDPSDSDNMVKVAVANNRNGSVSTATESGSGSINSGVGESHIIEAGNLVISVQVLKNVTKNFAKQNELGRGGFGVVYKGELDDGTKIAVKRMESGVISNKALDEFHAEIAVLSKVRHRHLVSLLGYSAEGNERILVYEYMPQGALSRHLFHWKSFGIEPLSWKRRLNIALDVARAMEYLHTLAHQSFIHRDLKSSNILLADDFRAKVSDFGLVKLAPNGEKKSVVTRLAGTFGYLAPEYAVTGKITTKVDVFSFGVVLMELLTGLVALDEDRPEETQYLAAWFWKIKSNKEKLMAAIDPSISMSIKEEAFETITIVAELAGHCTAREPGQRPDMSHAVNVLAPLVEKWKPLDDEAEEYSGIDYSLPLNQMVKDWQESEGKDLSYVDLEDSKSSIPARPNGFAESFNSGDGR